MKPCISYRLLVALFTVFFLLHSYKADDAGEVGANRDVVKGGRRKLGGDVRHLQSVFYNDINDDQTNEDDKVKRYMRFGRRQESSIWPIDNLEPDMEMSDDASVRSHPLSSNGNGMEESKRYMRFGKRFEDLLIPFDKRLINKRYMRFGRSADH